MRSPYWLLTSIALCLCVLWLGETITAQGGGAKPRLTSQQAISIRRLRDLRWRPNGSWVAFAVSDVPKGTDPHGHIWLYNDSSRELRQFTNSLKSESHPRWSSDGKKLAFLSDREGEFQQIFVMPSDGGEALRLTEGKRSVSRFEWSPDSKQIAFLAPEPKTESEEKKTNEKDDAKSVDRDDKRTHLWLADLESSKSRQVIGAPWHFSEVQWSGERLLAIATNHPESDRETNRIYSVSLKDGAMQEISALRGPLENLQVSPDGKWISCIGTRVDGPVPHDLYVQTVEGGSPQNVTMRDLDRPVTDYRWQPDGTLLITFNERFHSGFATTDTAGHVRRLSSVRSTTQDSALPQVVDDFALGSSGNVVFSGQNSTHPPELWTWDLKSAPRPASHFNDSFQPFALASMQSLRYRSFDGREVEGALLTPPGSAAAAKLPTIIIVHGGPTGNWSDEFEAWGQLLASAGYAVFYPNVRGSTGYGYDFMVLNRGDWGGGDFKDIMAAVDYLITRGIADPERLGIAGWSYGGYMAAWAITQTQRFKAAVSGAGMSDLAAEFGTEEHPAYDEWFYGLPYEKPDRFHRSSPLTYAKNAHTPTLILQGEADVIDPKGQSEALYRALKRYGVETELVIYPREGHGLKEEKHLVDRLNRLVAWFDKHLK
jgi:dipeptidyl aminopeptidase/acylaminoacyl peptidase